MGEQIEGTVYSESCYRLFGKRFGGEVGVLSGESTDLKVYVVKRGVV